MRKTFGLLALAAILAGVLSPAAAHFAPAGPNAPSPAIRMVEAGRVMAPIAHIVHCRTYQSQCRKSETPGLAQMSAARWQDLKTVNAAFNASIEAVSDRSARGVIDVWSVGGQRGDCEDYAIAKRSALIARGWSPATVLLAVVRDRGGGGHAVAVVRTDRGDFVLDNLTQDIRRWERTGYTWVKQQSSKNPRIWVRITKAAVRDSPN